MYLTIQTVKDILFNGGKLTIDKPTMQKVEDCYQFLQQFHSDKIIYGINTGFGPMAQWRVDDKYLTDLQYNIIRSHCTGTGEPLADTDVKAAMIARIGSFIQARSGVHPELISLLTEFINRGSTDEEKRAVR